jgi:tyrosyl-tRNA synthetase
MAPPTEEVLTEGDVKSALEIGLPLKHYIGFEISGLMHLGTGLVTMSKVAQLQKAGVKCSIFLADYHSWINKKLGDDLALIRKTAAQYYKEGFKKSIEICGGDPDKVDFVLGSELYEKMGNEYWSTVIEVAKNVNLARVMRSITIAGRKEGESVSFALMMYPMMQVADIFAQGINLAHSGADQRKAHVIARDVAPYLTIKPLMRKHNSHEEIYKPIALHNMLTMGLQQPSTWPIPKDKIKEVISEMKMSKSKPNSAVFLTDSEENIKRKLMEAFCPPKETNYNPVLQWAKLFIFNLGKELTIERSAKFGGGLHFDDYNEMEKLFAEGKLHPMDLKNAVADSLIETLTPIRKYFETPKNHQMIEELERVTAGIKKPK